MVADAALWVIFAAAIAFIYFGCAMTKPKPKPVPQKSDNRIDQAP